MDRPRVTTGKLLVLVAVVAANLTAGRVRIADEMMLYGVAPVGLAVQVAAYRLLRRRGRSRAFWGGFTVAGSVVIVLFVWGLTKQGQGSGELWAFNRLSHDLTWASRLFGFWAGCGALVAEAMQPSPKRPRPGWVWWYNNPNHRIWAALAACLGLFLTQLAFALAAGVITRLVAKWARSAGPPEPREGDAARINGGC